MKKLTILCDLDGIVADLLSLWISDMNRIHGSNVKLEQIHGWDIHNYVPMGRRAYDLLTAEMFDRLVPIPGSIASLKHLHKEGHQVVICTASAKEPETAAAKLRWIRKHTPFLDRKDVLIGHKKHLIKGDVFIDDSPENIREYRDAWPDAKILTLAYPYNADNQTRYRVDLRAKNWGSILSFLLGDTEITG